MTNVAISSPCIGVCSMDDLTGFCQGCYRTIDEIQAWWEMDDQQQKETINKAAQREAELFD